MKRRILGCMLLLMVVFQLTPVTSMVLADEFKVSGTVMNEEGEVLTGVIISAYEVASGAFVETTTTNSKGYFKFNLSENKHDLVFTQPGYATYTTSVTPDNSSVLMGNIQMSNALQLSTSASSRVTTPGTTLILPFTLSNMGAEDEDCRFSITTPQDWEVIVTDQISKLAGLQLFAGDSASFDLEVTVPITASGENNIQLTVIGTTMWTEWPLTIIIKEDDVSLLGCEFPSKSGSLGSLVPFAVNIQNPYDIRTSFSLDVSSVPETWEVVIRNANQDIVNVVLLDPNQSTDVIVEAQVPEDAEGGNYEFTVSTISPYHTDKLQLEVLVTETFEEAKLQAKYPSQSVPLDSTVEFEITIENPSQTDELFTLSAPEIPVGWELVFKAVKEDEQTQEIGAMLIEALETENIIVEITPSLNSGLGEYFIPIEAISSGARGSITLNTIVSGSYDARVRVDSLFVEIQAATTETVTVTVTNTGFSPLTNIELLVTSAPTDWTVETSPLKHTILDPNEAVEFQVSIQVPAEAARGDYLIELQPSMDQIAMEALEPPEIRVTVNPETAWGIYGLALVMAAFAVVFLIMMKFRRR